MLTKILFTLAVIIVIALVFRQKGAKRPAKASSKPVETGGVQTRTVIYALLGLVLAISALLFVLHWQDQHQIVNIDVTDGAGQKVTYQAYKKSISGRHFETLDGRRVTLGDSDRVEMTATE